RSAQILAQIGADKQPSAKICVKICAHLREPLFHPQTLNHEINISLPLNNPNLYRPRAIETRVAKNLPGYQHRSTTKLKSLLHLKTFLRNHRPPPHRFRERPES